MIRIKSLIIESPGRMAWSGYPTRGEGYPLNLGIANNLPHEASNCTHNSTNGKKSKSTVTVALYAGVIFTVHKTIFRKNFRVSIFHLIWRNKTSLNRSIVSRM